MGKTTHRSLGELGWNTTQERLGENRVGIPHIEPRRMTLEASGNSCGDARQENPGELKWKTAQEDLGQFVGKTTQPRGIAASRTSAPEVGRADLYDKEVNTHSAIPIPK